MKKLGIVFVVILLLANVSNVYAQDPSEVKRATPDLPGEIAIDFGYNILTNHPQYSWFRSRSFSIYFIKSFDLNKKIEFRPGIGWCSEKITVKPSELYALTPPISTDVSEINKFTHAINYIHVPLEFRFNSKGNDTNEGFFIGLGGSMALRFEDHLKMIYKDDAGTSIKMKIRQNTGLSNWRFGATARVGFRSVSLFYKYYFTDIHSVNYTEMQTAGITLSGL